MNTSPTDMRHTASPSSLRTAASSSSVSPSIPGNGQHSQFPLTLESVLVRHATSPNPPFSALEQVLSERNNLSAQNTQLWKLIEKQRSGYTQMLKDLERIRGERDNYKSKLQEVGLLESLQGAPKEKGLKQFASSSVINGRGGSPAPPRQPLVRHQSDDPVSEHSFSPSQDPSQQPQQDLGTPREPSRLNSLPQANTTQPPRDVREPTRNNTAPSLSHPHSLMPNPPPRPPIPVTASLSTQIPVGPPVFASGPSSSMYQASPQASHGYTQTPIPPTRSTSVPQPAPSQTPTPLVIPPRGQSLSHNPSSSIAELPPDVPDVTRALSQTKPLQLGKKSSPVSPASATVSSNMIAVTPATPASILVPLMPDVGHSSASSLSGRSSEHPGASTGGGQGSMSTVPLGFQERDRRDRSVRESHVSLPDEARRYIVNMSESPLPSPDPSSTSTPLLSDTSHENIYLQSPDMGEPVITNLEGTQARSRSEERGGDASPFLDMEDEESTNESSNDISADDEFEESGDVKSASSVLPPAVSEPNQARPTIAMNGAGMDERGRSRESMQYSPEKLSASMDGFGRTPLRSAAADDFPMPPSTHPAAYSYAQPQQHGAQPYQHVPHAQTSSPALSPRGASFPLSQMPSSVQALNSSLNSSQTLNSSQMPAATLTFPPIKAYGNPIPSSIDGSPTWAINQSTPTFRALPLLTSDLPSTSIHVSHSDIRPNDRGKEVLSFVIEVQPGNKEGWKVEKLYSDVLGLDQRVRNNMGKSVTKKMAALPDAKLFRDHAPAKVDQRKAALEVYLQALIHLPVKNKDEVVAFFSSDVLREANKPVSQAGYKEGYLTKRGKNFGGWKTRHFVLQGPVLEYYESRGGAHLGSIVITNAQIGRQQRSGDKREGDDENDYRHAFLIIEAKRGQNGAPARHVLCAESDAERDSWVEVLVRYVLGSYNEDPNATAAYGSNGVAGLGVSSQSTMDPTRSSTSVGDSAMPHAQRLMSRDEITVGSAVPLSHLPQDAMHPKFFHTAPLPDDLSSSPGKSSILSSSGPYQPSEATDMNVARRLLERTHAASGSTISADMVLPSSVPTSSSLDVNSSLAYGGPRSNSEMGHYPDLMEHRAGHGHPQVSLDGQARRERPMVRTSFHPALDGLKPSPTLTSSQEASFTPDTATLVSRSDVFSKVKISGPMNGTAIPAGLKFGSKDPPSEATGTSSADRREKAKSRTFWGFGRPNVPAEKTPAAPQYPSRGVFGVTLEESLAVAEIAHLPAIVFRCIQYLEAKKADQEEGIYRLSGSSAVIKNLKDRFNAQGDIDLLTTDEFWDPHAIAGLLKSFLRELPASILTRDLHLKFLAVMDFVDARERIKELSELIALLPIANYSLLRALTAHLILIVQNSNVNKMTMRNVGIVFSPTLGIPAGVFSLMMGEFNRVFKVDPDYIDEDEAPRVEAPEMPNTSNAPEGAYHRNSQRYADGAADELLGLAGRTLPSADDGQSDDGDEISVHYDSESESAENEAATTESATMESTTMESFDMSFTSMARDVQAESAGELQHYHSRTANLAATRGLSIVTGKDRRHSRMMGLPASPRPGGIPRSPQQTPTNTNGLATQAQLQANLSPPPTPR